MTTAAPCSANVRQQDEHVARLLADFTAVRPAALRALLERGRDAGD
jgi:hypothetical protein